MKNKILASFALAAACMLVAPMTAKAADYNDGWNQDSKGWWWYRAYDNSYAKDEIIWDEDKGYYFDQAGYMTTGWAFDPNEYGYWGTWRYSNASGELQTGWLKEGDTWYYLGDSVWDGMACNGWQCIDDEWYYFKPNGAMVTGWYNTAGAGSVYGNWIYCNADGSAYDGWVQYGGKWYYIEEGDMLTNSYISLVDGEYETYYSSREGATVYYVGRDGAMITGWYDASFTSETSSSSSWKYANADGTITKQWVQYNGSWYYVDEYGNMLQSRAAQIYSESEVPAEYEWDDSKTDPENRAAYIAAQNAIESFYRSRTYVFAPDGKMVVGWVKFTNTNGSTWYHTGADGVATTGWIQDGGKWYYCWYGKMLQNTVTPDGYYVGPDGVWVN